MKIYFWVPPLAVECLLSMCSGFPTTFEFNFSPCYIVLLKYKDIKKKYFPKLFYVNNHNSTINNTIYLGQVNYFNLN